MTGRSALLAVAPALALCSVHIRAQDTRAAQNAAPLYRQRHAYIESRVDDLLRRMTLEEKVRQLDIFAGATLVDKLLDRTHAAPDGVFLPEKAQALFGDLGAGSIHDLYPTAQQSNAIRKWVIEHNRLGIPTLFTGEGLLGFNKGTVFPAPLNLAATWNPEIAPFRLSLKNAF